MVSEVRYHPYGQERWSNGATPTDFGFTSQRNEASFGLMDYNARYYSPVLGRFVSPDSIVPEPTSSGGFNRYRYARNSPLMYTDPTGHQGEPWWKDTLKTIRNWFCGGWNSISACPTDTLIQAVDSVPNVSELQDQVLTPPLLVNPAQVEQLKDILGMQDQVMRAAELAKIFQYQPPAEGGPGTYDFALQPREEQAKTFAETYGLSLDGVDVVYDPNRGSGRLGQYLAPGDVYRGVAYERETLILGPDAFSDPETLGTTIFHELVHHADSSLSEEEVRNLEDAWKEWYRSLPPEQQ